MRATDYRTSINSVLFFLSRLILQIANLAPNHRANDVIIVEGGKPIINARFCYGPMDLVDLAREDISTYLHLVGCDWNLLSTNRTDMNGRISVSVPDRIPCGIHCAKMIVHGDRTFVDVFIAVLPYGTRCVVFSIDGSLTSSVSVTGKDPRLQPGVVDVVRFWHDLGYPIIYVTARPDMQQKAVTAWLGLHNFPHGLLFFTPSFSTDPLRQKLLHLKALVEMGITIHAAYGSNKDVPVYSSIGIAAERIFTVRRGKLKGCVHLDGYSAHLSDLSGGAIPFAEPVESSLLFQRHNPIANESLVRRTHSFASRSGRYRLSDLKEKKQSISTQSR
ncbi:hypothetical protein AB6A40_003628 [Gnathostoma spinigerum]|uniref:LNS2/PITP domain-containing protein n=1 Tax=Gnathostoma spinigerum TaxID=75299 RepID=A0ABD6EA41_9BILA